MSIHTKSVFSKAYVYDVCLVNTRLESEELTRECELDGQVEVVRRRKMNIGWKEKKI